MRPVIRAGNGPDDGGAGILCSKGNYYDGQRDRAIFLTLDLIHYLCYSTQEAALAIGGLASVVPLDAIIDKLVTILIPFTLVSSPSLPTFCRYLLSFSLTTLKTPDFVDFGI